MNDLFYFLEARKLMLDPKRRGATSPVMVATCNSLMINLIGEQISELQRVKKKQAHSVQNPGDLAAVELAAVCIHEAGHVVALQALGGVGFIRTMSNPTPCPEEKDWIGWTVIVRPATAARANNVVSAAGLMAELIHSGNDEFSVIDVFEFNCSCNEWISDSDADGLRHCTIDDLATTHKILMERWEEVIEKAEAEKRKKRP